MHIKYKQSCQPSMRLGDLVQANGFYDRCFQYQGHLYVIVDGRSSHHHTVTVTSDYVLVFNLKSRTMRAIDYRELVWPVHAEVHVCAPKHEPNRECVHCQ